MDTSGRGTPFLYMSVNKILIHVFKLRVFGPFFDYCEAKKNKTFVTKSANERGQKHRVTSLQNNFIYMALHSVK